MKTLFLGSLALSALLQQAAANELVMKKFMDSRLKMNALRTKQKPETFLNQRIDCVDGSVTVGQEVYNCNGIDFLSFISADDLEIPGPQFLQQSSDIWGWYDTELDREITILTLDTGVVFIDSTDALNPCILSKHHSARPPSAWGDVKVVGDFAYTIKDKTTRQDTAPGVGMEVYDLRKLRNLDCKVEGYEIPELGADFIGKDHGSCHNVISNTETGRVYSCGCRDTCNGGLVAFDVSKDPLRPEFIGCVDADGYTHDAQCVVYRGPDSRYAGREVCLAFNENTVTIWDVTDMSDPLMLSRVGYNSQAYSHQGWFNKDMTKILHDDELDEVCTVEFDATCEFLAAENFQGTTKTTTYVWNVEDLENPVQEQSFVHRDDSIDHNLYVWGAIHEHGWGGNAKLSSVPDQNLAFLNNYMAGLIILDIGDENPENWVEVKSFDITETTEVEFEGAWSGYMHPSGVYAISSIEKGIFFLDPNVEFKPAAIQTSFPTPSPPPPGDDGEGEDDDSSGASAVLYVFFVFFLIATVGVAVVMGRGSKKGKGAEEESFKDDEAGEEEAAQVKQVTV